MIIFSFGAGNTCVMLRRHVFVTSYVAATRISFAYCFSFSFSDLTKLKPTDVTMFFTSQTSKGLKQPFPANRFTSTSTLYWVGKVHTDITPTSQT